MFGLTVLFLTALVLLTVILTAMAVRELRRPPRRTVAYAIAHGLACDPGDAGFEFESWTLDLSDGARLAVWEIVQRPDVPQPLTAVLVHGWGESRIDSLARRDQWWGLCDRIVAYDLRGHGEAAPERGVSRLGAGEERDLLALLERLGEGRFLLVGWGMGAAIALSAAQTQGTPREGVVGIVAIEPELDLRRRLLGHLAARGFPTRPVGVLALRWLALIGCRPPEFPERTPETLSPVAVIGADGVNEAVSRLAEAARTPRAV